MLRIVTLTQQIDTNATIYLVGSHATETHSPTSDIDFLIVSDKQAQIIKHLTKNLKNEPFFKQLDCKVITPRDLILFRNRKYTFLLSMILFGKLLNGKPISTRISPPKLEDEKKRFLTEVTHLESMIHDRANFYLLCVFLFNLAKFKRHLIRLVDPTLKLSLKDILKSHLFWLGKKYEFGTKSRSPITDSIETRFTFPANPKKNCDYEKLFEVLETINDPRQFS